MRLKYLTLCLLGLSFGGCSQHVIKPNAVKSERLEQRAVDGLNSIFETSSYDIHGQFAVQTDVKKSDNKPKKNDQVKTKTDSELEKQIDKALKAQNVKLSPKEKKTLYGTLVSYSDLYGYSEEDEGLSSTQNSLLNLLNDLQVNYDGSVHYRQKLAALNLNFKYQKSTLLVQAKVPMVVDFNEYKFYTNYFALLPFLVNKESQESYAYFDFSKFKEDFQKADTKQLLEYFKQVNALPYALANVDQISSVSLSEQDRKNEISEKIRLKTDIQTLLLQVSLFEWVNERYRTEQILGKEYLPDEVQDAASAADEAAANATAAAEEVVDAAEQAYMKEERIREKAYESGERVQELVSTELHRTMYHGDDENYGVASAVDACAAEGCDEAEMYVDGEELDADDYVEASAATAYDEEEAVEMLSEQACNAFLRSKASKIPVGSVNFCSDYYGIELLNTKDNSSEENLDEDYESALDRLKPIFAEYQSKDLVDVNAFKVLWLKHQAEIQDALNKEYKSRATTYVDVGLDLQGRVKDLTYDILKDDARIGKIRFLSQTQITNYNQATPIDRKVLKNAKTFEEVSKGSIVESFASGITRSLGQYSEEYAEGDEYADQPSIYDQLDKVAKDTFNRTDSYVKAYQAVFVILYAARRPDAAKYYSATDLNEIAELHAYYFNDELEKPNATTKKRLDKLAERHQLKSGEYFDDVGSSVGRIVDEAIGEQQEKVYWKQLMQKAKTKQAAFAQHYEKLFKEDYGVSSEEKNLTGAAKLLSQAYVDDLKGKLSKNSVKALKEEYDDYLDYSLYRKAYYDIENYLSK